MKSVKFSSLLNTPFVLYPIKWVVWCLLKSLRITVSGDELIKRQKRPFIIALWHDQIPLAPLFTSLFYNTPLRLIVSNSRDGNLLAAFAKTFSNVSITRVVHNKKHQALAEMVCALETGDEIILITPDGPRGPAHKVKPGVIYAAQKTNRPIVAMRWTASRYWQCSSWDKMKIPKPFSKVSIYFSEPLYCPLDKEVDRLEKALIDIL
jgi:lysophospholipid acyltransferase (LPLAT)-like uncharacterized protein